MKKLLSIVIAMVIIVGVLPVTASAASGKVDVYGCSISAAAKQVCFVVCDRNEENGLDLLMQYMAENEFAPGFSKYYYVPEGTVIDFKVIAEKLPELQNLAVVYGEVKNLSALADMENLVWLGLYQNEGVDSMSFLKKLPKLKKLRYVNSCESIKPLSYLKELTDLRLTVSSEAISDLTPLKSLTKLKKLEIGNTISENISALGNIKSLKELDIDVESGTDLSFLKKLTKLESLSVEVRGDGFAEGLDSIASLKKLKSLTLNGFDSYYTKEEIDGYEIRFMNVMDLSFIGKIKSLESLDISYCNATFIENIGDLKGLKELKIMDLKYKLHNMSFLKDLTGLEYLSLDGQDGLKGSDISGLKNLKTLILMYSRFDDLSGLKKCTSLEKLTVFDCYSDFDVKWIPADNIKDILFKVQKDDRIKNMDKLASLKKLEILHLDNTGISEKTIKKIKKALPKCRIEVYEQGYEEYAVY